MKARVRVVIVTYNASQIIRGCLQSLEDDYRSGLIEVIIVDNNSSDDTTAIIHNEFSWASLIESGINGGFGSGNNLGAKDCDTDYLYFLNSDARSMPGSIKVMVDLLDRERSIGITAPLIVDETGNKTISSYRFVTPGYAIWIALGLNRIFPLNKVDNYHEVRRHPLERRASVDRILGAAFLMQRDIFVRLGGFDERYFLYSEEEDLCLQTRRLGYEIVFEPTAVAVHLGGKTLAPHSILGIASASWSLKYFLYKNYPGIASKCALAIWNVMLVVKMVLTWLFVYKQRGTRLKGYLAAIKSLMIPGYYDTWIRPATKQENRP